MVAHHAPEPLPQPFLEGWIRWHRRIVGFQELGELGRVEAVAGIEIPTTGAMTLRGRVARRAFRGDVGSLELRGSDANRLLDSH